MDIQSESNTGNDVTEYGSIFVKLSKDSYSPGEQVSGVILLHLKSDHNDPKVWLQINGHEKLEIAESRLATITLGSEDHMMKREGRPLFDYRLPAYIFRGSFIPAGSYTIPFSFILEKDIPSSFEYNFEMHDEECIVQVEYHISAQIEEFGTKNYMLEYDMRFAVNQAVDYTEARIREEVSGRVKSCFCFDRGYLDVVAELDKNVYSPNETATLTLEIDNSESKVSIEKINVALYQELKIQVGSFTHKFNHKINQYAHQGIKSGDAKTGNEAFKLKLPLQVKESKPHWPPNILPTCQSKFIDNHYRIVCEIKIQGCQLKRSFAKIELTPFILSQVASEKEWKHQPTPWIPRVIETTPMQIFKYASIEDKLDSFSPRLTQSFELADTTCPILHSRV